MDIPAAPDYGSQVGNYYKTLLAGLVGGGGGGQPAPAPPAAAPAADPNAGGLQGSLLRLLGIQQPDWISNLNSALKTYGAGGGAPAAPAAAPAAPSMGPATAPVGQPRVNQRAPMGPGGMSFDLGQMPTMPQVPTFTPPQLPGIKPYDFTQYKALLDKANVTPTENLSNVLGGLAKGAGSVSAVEPGSFAHALAAAGAGGMAGLHESAVATREDAQRRAANELTMQSLQHSASKDSAELAFKGAELTYQANVQSQLLKYQQGMKVAELEQPQIQHDANGVTIKQVDPASGKISAQYHPTKTFLDHAEKMKDVITAISGNGPVAEATEAKMVLDSYKDQPQLAQAALTQLAVRRTVENGAGQSVFGTTYEVAAKQAAKQINLENPTLQTKPDLFQKELEHRVTAILLNDPRINKLGWLHSAAPHSVAARILSGALGGGSTDEQ